MPGRQCSSVWIDPLLLHGKPRTSRDFITAAVSYAGLTHLDPLALADPLGPVASWGWRRMVRLRMRPRMRPRMRLRMRPRVWFRMRLRMGFRMQPWMWFRMRLRMRPRVWFRMRLRMGLRMRRSVDGGQGSSQRHAVRGAPLKLCGDLRRSMTRFVSHRHRPVPCVHLAVHPLARHKLQHIVNHTSMLLVESCVTERCFSDSARGTEAPAG